MAATISMGVPRTQTATLWKLNSTFMGNSFQDQDQKGSRGQFLFQKISSWKDCLQF